MKPTIDLVYFNAGGGHRAATDALEQVVAQLGLGWQLRRVNLFEVLDPRQRVKDWLGLQPEDLYNRRLQQGRTRGMQRELRLLQGAIRLAHGPLTRRLQAHWQATRPDLVVSLIPNFNRCLYESVRQALPRCPFVTVMTDLADLPPHFWIESGQQQHIVCGSDRAVRQALDAGFASGRVHRTSGMVIRPDFYRAPLERRHALRASLGLDPDRPVGLVMFGGHGARQMLDLALAMDRTQFIFICGHNADLADRLHELQRPAAQAVVGHTDKVAFYMGLADFFIGKPGPGCMSEALQSGLPVVTWDNEATIPQERFNAAWLLDHQAGLVVPSLKQVPGAVATLLADLPAWQARARAVRNQAVFEVPQILEAILRQAGALAPAAPEADVEDAVLAA